jgi:two-component system phosphate regulon sensor histidine kinase PhoR
MVEGVIAINPEGRVSRINAAARRLLDITTLVVEGRLVEEVIHRADIQRSIKDALKGGEGYSAIVKVSGLVPRVLELHASGLVGGAKMAPGTMIVIHDITRIDRLETIRRDFVANVSHELRTPVTSIMGFVETLLEGAMHEQGSLERFLRIIGRQAERLHSIFNDLLTLARLEAGGEGAIIELERKESRDLAQAAVDDCAHRASEKGMNLVVDVPPGLVVLVNPSMIEQSLVNLIDNAIKYSEPDREIRVEARQGQEFTELRVVDRGPGIDKEHVPRLFERFYRIDRGRSRQLGGTGLGLAIVKHIAQAHGGRVGLESTLGEGSAFSIFVRTAR